MDYKINKESVDKVFSKSEPVEITEDMLSESKLNLEDFIYDAWKESLKNNIRANTVMISKRLAKVNRFVHLFGTSYAEFPPLICGLEAYVTDELPEEFAFGVVEAPETQRELVFENGRKAGYRQGYDEGYEQGVTELAERIKNYYSNITMGYMIAHQIDEVKKELLEDNHND